MTQRVDPTILDLGAFEGHLTPKPLERSDPMWKLHWFKCMASGLLQ